MTKWNRSETSLKSSAYNHNGQNYFEQLTTYNSMSSHLRRVLLAKCVIDSRNKNFATRRKQFCKQIECKPHFSKRKITDDLIDRLAYDTLHHPADVVQMHYNSRYSCHDEDRRSPAFKSNKYGMIQSDDTDIDERSARTILKDQDVPQCRYTKDSIFYERISDVRTTRNNRAPLRCDDDCKAARVTDNSSGNQQNPATWEEGKYVNFVYEITRDILHNHYFTDDQLREVFKRHIERNKEHLNVNRMMFEIYQLKMALNIADNLDDDDCDGQPRPPRPPTPPKVLDDNKVLEKLMLFEADRTTDKPRKSSLISNRNDRRRSSTASEKSVVLVDANCELVLTENDVLSSLLESDINPNDAQKIYRRLFTKSKELMHGFADLVYTGTEQPTQTNAENDNCTNGFLDPTLGELNDVEASNENEKGSTTQDLMTQEDKDVQV